MRVEDQYTDVLQNIEFGIVITYRNYPEMSDYNVMRMLEAIIDSYVAEKIKRPPRNFSLSDTEKTLMENVRRMCEWRMGRGGLSLISPAKEEKITPSASEVKAVDEIILCLKRILKSVRKWNKNYGRQGYLNFIVQYVK